MDECAKKLLFGAVSWLEGVENYGPFQWIGTGLDQASALLSSVLIDAKLLLNISMGSVV